MIELLDFKWVPDNSFLPILIPVLFSGAQIEIKHFHEKIFHEKGIPSYWNLHRVHQKVPRYVNTIQLVWKPQYFEIDLKILFQRNGSLGAFSLCYCFPIPLWEGRWVRITAAPVETNHRENCHLLTALLRWHRLKLGEKWKESEIGENAVKNISLKTYLTAAISYLAC